jgi:GNAT superfamily N-acetyltransferase
MEDEREVTLRDGARVLVRPVRPEDRALFVAGFQHLSEESRMRRFLFYKKSLGDRELDFLTHPDHQDHEAIGAVDPTTGNGVAVARMIREDDPEAAEAAVTVVDEWQGRGLGSLLLEGLGERARAIGVKRFTATLLTSNRAMLAAFHHLGCVRSHREAGGQEMTIDVEFPTQPGDDSLSEALRSAAAGDVEAVPS